MSPGSGSPGPPNQIQAPSILDSSPGISLLYSTQSRPAHVTMRLPSLTLIASGLFLAYIGNSIWTIYSMFYPVPCPPKSACIKPYLARKPGLQLFVYTSTKQRVTSETELSLLWTYDNFSVLEEKEQIVNVTLPSRTQKNGSLYTHVFLAPQGVMSPFSSSWRQYAHSALTTYSIPQAETFKLMGGNASTENPPPRSRDRPVSHWRSRLTVSIMSDEISFSRGGVPGEIHHLLSLDKKGEYLPILYVDELSYRTRDLQPINTTVPTVPLTITYKPISVGKLRLWLVMAQSMKHLHDLGFTDKDTDEMKGIFSDTNLTFLMLTFTVAAFHLLFDVLAFKNDISYWKNRDTMVGLSTRTVVWRCVSTFIIFLYLMDEETSMLVLVPAGIGSLIELWKVKKAFKAKLIWSGWRPTLEYGAATDQEVQTKQYDSQAMTYLSYILYPLCLGGAVYSLVYTPHKSWYSWCVQSLVNGVYAFGFLFMLPQLFVNYKMKSVAHLPWRAFMYKAFNTFIDDVFAFIITMPTAHRLACFRDDVVFLFYLYQRWLYPVDRSRVNEYGQSFDDDKNTTETKKTK